MRHTALTTLLLLALNRFEERLQGYTEGRDVISGRTATLQDTLTVSAKTPMVLELTH